ncbi:Uncharacterised protein [Vibrio cholerae]|nr:Uncharacterised protein [Vibrio cholerae]CSB35056.1 Uncharacterised protein [Vibrio cholerae]CSC12649.1 Uncharacterised protein [Vibrio cholerae]CSC16280.1 Uncharacterised protein [Vibrio cholerae]CSC31871.1 Uncharacterised protein [Vibrio cholerae]
MPFQLQQIITSPCLIASADFAQHYPFPRFLTDVIKVGKQFRLRFYRGVFDISDMLEIKAIHQMDEVVIALTVIARRIRHIEQH